MDEITYDNVVEMEEFKNKKRINTPVYKLIRECEAVLEKELQDRTITCKEKIINNFSSIPREWFIFTPKDKINNDGLPRLTTEEQSRIIITGCTTGFIYNQDFPEKGLVPSSTIFGSDDDDYLPPAC